MPAPQRGAKHARSREGAVSAGVVALHRSRFVEWQPAGVIALAASGDGSVLAAAREDGDIELYETSTSYCFQRLPGHKDACLTCMVFVDEEESKGGLTSRLFTAGLDGTLVEWDVEGRKAGPAADSLGGAVWQLAAEPGACIKSDSGARIAAACDDGSARIFLAEAGVPGLTYARTLPRVEGRVLAVAWHPSGDVLATAGTDGCIHLWSISGSRELLRITAGDGSGSAASGQSCIWSLLVLADGTVVSGDSSGNVQFWDGRFGTLLASFSQHQADVLQLAASPDGNMVFAAGVDPQLALFQRLPDPQQHSSAASGGKPPAPWAYLSSKRPHSHDVRALCVAGGRNWADGPRLFSGGNDTQLLSHAVEGYLKEHPVRINPCPQLPLLQAACSVPGNNDASATAGTGASSSAAGQQQPPWLLCAQRCEVDVWQLADAGGLGQLGPPAEGMLLSPAHPPEHLLRIVVQSGRHVSAACISQDASWLAYSDAQRMSAIYLERRPADELVPSAHAVPQPLQLPADLPPACHLAFRPGTAELVAASSDGTIRLIDLAALRQQQQQQQDGQQQQGGKKRGSKGGSKGGSAASGAGSGTEGTAVQALRAVHDLHFKSSLRRDRQRSAARRLMPLLELMAVSPDGSWLAAVVRQRVHLLSLATHKLVHSLLPLSEPQPPITAMTFTADGSTLVLAAANHQLAAYDVVNGQPTEWTLQHSGSLPPKLLKMPGAITAIASCPAAPTSLFLQSPEACCHLDLSVPLGSGDAADGRSHKRRRSKPVLASEPPGANCRMIYCSDPVLHAAYLGPEALLVVERPWEEVHKKIAAPMYRHRYGT